MKQSGILAIGILAILASPAVAASWKVSSNGTNSGTCGGGPWDSIVAPSAMPASSAFSLQGKRSRQRGRRASGALMRNGPADVRKCASGQPPEALAFAFAAQRE